LNHDAADASLLLACPSSVNDRYLRDREIAHTAGVDLQPSLATAVKPQKAGCLAAAHAAFGSIAARR
jgi:hypothetical protein